MKRLLIILSLLISFTSFAQNKKSLLREGNTLYADSSYNDAEMQYRKSLEKDQDYFNASFNLADAVYKQERYEESSALFGALIDNAPTESDLSKVYHNMGNSLVKEQKLDEAIDAYKNALRINPNDAETRHNLALCKKQKQEQEQQQEKNKEDKEDKEEQEENKEDKEGEKKEEQEKNEQKNENQEQKQEDQQNQQEEKKEEMSKEDAEKMLEAIQQQEKDLQEELQKKKVKGKKVKVLKDW